MNKFDNLNETLNEICVFIDENYPSLLDNLRTFSKINTLFYLELKDYDFSKKSVHNRMNFLDVMDISRSIIKQIDENYLNEFDRLIETGELNFVYENQNNNNYFLYHPKSDFKEINIDREFNYHDVILLIHEFMHYKNFSVDNGANRRFLTEFLSIYFETFSIDYLINKLNISSSEIDFNARFRNIMDCSKAIFRLEIILNSYVNFGSISDETFNDFNKYEGQISKEEFDNIINYYLNLSKQFNKLNKEEKYEVIENFFLDPYRYVLSTLICFNARKNSNFEDIVKLNNEINDNINSLSDVLKNVHINIDSDSFVKDSISEIEKFYLNCISNMNKTR